MKRGGFTTVELITVIVIVGILSVAGLSMMSGNSMAGPAFRGDLVSTLRYAQKTAVSHRRLVCAAITAANGPTKSAITLTIASVNGAAACNTALLLADGTDSSISSRDLSATTSASTTLYFQPDGSITTAGGAYATAPISLSGGDTSIAIQGETGYVE